ncbi:hypothetical protein [Laceyella putida]|uniref:Uncharacterized protein n=1 Tax=Laceyella putida TaxID=110101 RepID=A0ABW2RMK6_9BACL
MRGRFHSYSGKLEVIEEFICMAKNETNDLKKEGVCERLADFAARFGLVSKVENRFRLTLVMDKQMSVTVYFLGRRVGSLELTIEVHEEMDQFISDYEMYEEKLSEFTTKFTDYLDQLIWILGDPCFFRYDWIEDVEGDFDHAKSMAVWTIGESVIFRLLVLSESPEVPIRLCLSVEKMKDRGRQWT